MPANLVEMASLCAFALAGVVVVALSALRGWQGWLALKTRELDLMPPNHEAQDAALRQTGNRIELADLKERIRKLEAIAAGVDL